MKPSRNWSPTRSYWRFLLADDSINRTLARYAGGVRSLSRQASVRQEQLADRERERIRLEVVAVAQDHHGDVLPGPADDHVAEALTLPRMPFRVAAEAPAEAVVGVGVGDGILRRECELA